MTLLPAFLDISIEPPIDGGELVCISSLRSFVISKLSNQAPLLVIAPSTRIADELADEIRSYLGDVVSNFPAWETLPHERLSPKSDTVTTRIKALHQINSKKPPKITITSIRGALQPIVSDILEEELIKISSNKTISMAELTKRLSYFGFTRTDLVEKRGDFAVRGGILDLLSLIHI
jgi:transcription-repair coupling factor (superfamily II helicase)